VASEKRTRGANKGTPWARNPDDGVSILRLALDASDPVHRAHLEAMFRGAYAVRRALQHDARNRSAAYWEASRERDRNPAAARDRLGLSRSALAHAAYAHLDAAPHLRRFVTKALAMHLAHSVWTATGRHLFRDTSGRRHGPLRIGRWYDFTRLPGRARSHRSERKWETFRLHGTLAGHRAAYTHEGAFTQPNRLVAPVLTDWWGHEGPLVVVFSGLAVGTLVLPVRLPTAPSNQPILDHHLADPAKWHKIDLVRRRAPNFPGGWRYEAHLMVLTMPYVSPATAARRAAIAIAAMDRLAGVDVNVSNITSASHAVGRAMRVTRVERDATQQQRDRSRARRKRRRQRALDRSRRAMNRAQYQLSKRQAKRARRRLAAGLAAVDVIPMGPRTARADGVPLRGYRQDDLSASYRRRRAEQVAEAASITRARRDLTRKTAAKLVSSHGYQFLVEEGSIAAWSRSWGRAVAAFSPGALIGAIDREARAVGAIAGSRNAGVQRIATRTTALSQHCPCGQRVAKRLEDRVHICPRCGLRGDRDAVSAVLAAFVVLERGDPMSARVDYAAATEALAEIRRALRTTYSGWQDTLSESTDLSARDGSFITWKTSTSDFGWMARRIVGTVACPTLNESGTCHTTSERARWRTNMSSQGGPHRPHLRDSSYLNG
jgi:hypothetical protein